MGDSNTVLETGPLPAPRLQLRWASAGAEDLSKYRTLGDWLCHYELVIPLGEYDIRREIWVDGEQQDGELTELVIPIKAATLRGGGREPCKADWSATGFFDDIPFRDGAHAYWDAKALGGLPVYAIAVTGEALRVRYRDEAEAA